ncbi:M14 family metallopeptidase [uncultured Winogradskyella sp.]|uniref:M14 family metallopeptidase n=1 Tax=uncultured Winogradskyella sp. TaxID=395353 RepID=UPI0026126741|nr:M14 family metallopeptidase [uncultured Winogradskyella sp.]
MKNTIIILILLISQSVSSQLRYDFFRSPEQIDEALNFLHSTHPSLTKITTIGFSEEGKPIKALKISSNPDVDDASKADIVFMSLIHSREWISVETLLYIADTMLLEYQIMPELRADINNSQIWFIPVANPDGHEFSRLSIANRLWKKNRKENSDGSYGVDLNRNWGHEWGLDSGSTSTPSDYEYRGTMAFSEKETKAIRDFISDLSNLKALVSYHSYSELYLKPWAYTFDDAPGEKTLESIARRNIDLIESVHGHRYAESIWYTASGETTDFIWEEYRTAAFTPELRPASRLLGGFAPPTSEILPCAQENYPVAKALVHDAARTGLYIKDHATDLGAEPSAIETSSGGWSTPFWVSPDIWTVPSVLNQNALVDLNVRINNNTGTTQNGVTLEVYYTDPRISLEFPNPNAMLIDRRENITVPPSGSVQTFQWRTPTGTNSMGELHWCIGAVVKHRNDMPLSTQIQKSSNVSCRNFNTTEIVEASMMMTIAAQNFLEVPAELIYTIDDSSLKDGWTIELPNKILKRTSKVSPSSLRKSKLLKTKGIIIEPGETVYLPVSVKIGSEVSKNEKLKLNIHGKLFPLVAGKREAVGNGFTFDLINKN